MTCKHQKATFRVNSWTDLPLENYMATTVTCTECGTMWAGALGRVRP